jgi:hypothetical protein
VEAFAKALSRTSTRIEFGLEPRPAAIMAGAKTKALSPGSAIVAVAPHPVTSRLKMTSYTPPEA